MPSLILIGGTIVHRLQLFIVNWSADDTWALLTLICACLAAAVVGVSLFLRRLSLLGDALSHAVLPGVIAAVVVAGTTAAQFVLLGALGAALMSVGVVRSLIHLGLTTEAALGATFSTFFALGIFGLNLFGEHIDLDPSCILYGSLELIAFETVAFAGDVEIPRAAITSVVTLASVLLLTITRRRAFCVIAFEPERLKLHYSSMARVCEEVVFLAVAAAAIVNSFFTIGAVATTGILIAPAVIARLLCRTMRGMWIVVAVSTCLIATTGYVVAYTFDAPVAGAVSGLGLVVVALAALVSPHGGILVRFLQSTAMRMTVRVDDCLADLYRRTETPETNLVQLGFWARIELRLFGFVDASCTLTERGYLRARSLVRSHRVWEQYLANQLEHKTDHVHELSDRMEHFLSSELTEQIAAATGAIRDPHGKVIPPRPEDD